MSLHKDLIFLILQFCHEENLKRTAHMLEQETGYFFNLKYFHDLVLNGNWEEAEKYLSSFTVVEDNMHSTSIYFEIRKQKYLEALDKHDSAVALDILLKDLKVFAMSNEELCGDMSRLLVLDDFREHSKLTSYGDTTTARKRLSDALMTLIQENPLLLGRLVFPQINRSRLKYLINQSLSWQHNHCAHPDQQPHIDTLLTDHKCLEPDSIEHGLDTESSSSSNPMTIRLLRPLDEEEVSRTMADVKLQTHAESHELEMLSVSQIGEVAGIQFVLLFTKINSNVIRNLVYTNAGDGILALADDGMHLLWTWSKNDTNLDGKATIKCAPQLSQLSNGPVMTADLLGNSLDVITPCFSLSRDDSYVISACGKNITVYRTLKFEKRADIELSPHAVTCIIFYPPDENIIIVGMDDSSILVYQILEDKVVNKLEGHSRRICGLAFSTAFNVLISSAVDTQIVLWDYMWEKKKSAVLKMSIGLWASDLLSETYIELDKDQKELLAVHETQLAIYEITTLQCLKQWAVANNSPRISHATFSCDSQMVYAVMRDGILIILGASGLTPIFKIDHSTYLPSYPSFTYPVVVAAHPHKPNHIALGLTNGGIAVVEFKEGLMDNN